MEIYTIGFTKKTAERFFESLKSNRIERLVDVRLNNVSQLAGFAKRQDLEYFLKNLCSAEYVHEPLLAPTQEMLDGYKKDGGAWADYEEKFLSLMRQRRVESSVSKSLFSKRSVLLCSEDKPHQCHRRVAAEYLKDAWGGVTVHHL